MIEAGTIALIAAVGIGMASMAIIWFVVSRGRSTDA